MLEATAHDVRYAIRSLIRQPGVTALAVGILALGLGINAAVLAVAYGVLWRPLPYLDVDRLITIAEVYEEDGVEHRVGFGEIDEWNRRLRAARVAGYATRERAVRGVGPTRVMAVATVSGDFFDVLGVPAARGVVPRLPGGDSRAVISAPLARTFEDETGRSALGQAVTVGDRRYDVVAVMGDEFAFPSADVDVWLVVAAASGAYRLVGRMPEGTTIAGARDDATRVVREIDGELWSAAVRSIEETLLGEVRPVVRVSIAAALLVLVVACANTVTLLIGRSVRRSREFAVRIALGSGMARLVRAALVEGLVVAIAGLLLGLAAAWVGLRLFTASAAEVVPRVDGVTIDIPVVLAGLVLTLLVGVVCGCASAFTGTRRDTAALRNGMVATGSPTTRRLRGGLVAAQIALSIVLLTGAGLLVRTVDRLVDEESGFEPDRALTARLMLADRMFVDGGAATAVVDTLLERVRGLPGVQAAGVGSILPPDEAPLRVSMFFESENRNEWATFSFGTVTSGYFEALGTPLAAGRRFDAADDLADVSPVMLSETAARFVYPNQDPVGRPMIYDFDVLGIARGDSPVIAVVSDVKHEGLDAPRTGSMYVPWRRAPTGVSHLVVRTGGDPAALVPAVRDLIRTLNPSLPVPEVRPLADHVAGSIAERRLRVVPAGGFAALALAVAMVGLFGTLARSVSERRQELAIRAAVGASPGRLVRLVMKGSLLVTAVGLMLGTVMAAATGRNLAGLLYGVGPYDGATFATVVAVVAVAALAASVVPARRAARLDPLTALRAE
ncbi:MAG: ABC transporter permease [Acidobacteriota bacterium]|nr:ABC transporter permease [Acidobacteriota bacterium]